MSDHPTPKCLFIGGTADGRRMVVDDPRSQQRIRSLAEVTNDPHALDDGDPRPETMAVAETYLPCAVTHGEHTETIFALNALSDHAITTQLVKHFGLGATFRRTDVSPA